MRDLQSLLDELSAGRDVAGISVAVGRGAAEWTATSGVLSRDTGFPVGPDSVFQIGSVTKLLTAALVMQLVEEGTVGLDDPVRRHLPTFRVKDPEVTRTVTVRHLLTHTGGFDGDIFTDTGRGDDALDRYVALLGDAAGQLYPPGALFSYCNSGYCVLGALAVRLRGADTWEALVRERLFEPLGMSRTALFADEALMFGAAVGHLRSPAADSSSGGGGGLRVVSRWQMPRSNAPAGSTPCAAPRELLKLGRYLLTHHPAMRDAEVRVPGPPIMGSYAWSLGAELFDWNGTPAFGHDGGTPGQDTVLRIVPGHDLVVAICSNGNGYGLMRDLLGAIVSEMTGVTVPAGPVPPAAPRALDVTPFLGRYAYPMAEYEVTGAEGGISLRTTPVGFAAEAGGEPRVERYVALTDDTFVSVEGHDGAHSTVTFVDGFLHAGRVARRV
ncbi:serine hydrolase [Virgisporangium aliadipatigenens]|uniref:Serine hydrolase n=1 Tax=Virgisporangium aliadipatigenens TaxID=741659 RepID=A0A8J4DN07_9ACTN|nr:serine hydrolase domain-containing protein [Virgisporangium aliadipatigenens]GIJ43914.1 serine hydrolase [Virgisporangium aliadipatigenens]